MCLFPKKILNKSRQFDARYSPLYHVVPCGKCEECLKRHVDEYILRADAEFDYNVSIGGQALFLTLTYDDKYLPVTDGIQHFNTAHIRDFFNRLRIYCSRSGINSKHIRYFLVSEYGGQTKRPHYHAIIFFPTKVNSWDYINRFTENGIFQRAWKYGYCSYSKKHGAYVKSKACNRYCCKYLAKFEDYYKQKDAYELGKRIPATKPFHRQSKGFGIYMLQQLSQWEILNNTRIVQTKKFFYHVQLPVYIQRKLYYTYEKSLCLFRINQLGIQIKTNAIYKRVQDYIYKAKELFNGEFIKYKHSDDEVLNKLESDSFDSILYDVKKNINSFKDDFAFSHVMRFFCGNCILNWFDRISKYFNHLFTAPYQDSSYLNHDRARLLFSQTYGMSPEYLNFRPIFDIIDFTKDSDNVILQDIKYKERKQQEQLLNLMNHENY